MLGVTAVVCSRTMFIYFDDPEGPNLLVVMVAAAIIYFLSLAAYLFNPVAKNTLQDLSLSTSIGFKSFIFVLIIQIIITTAFYFCLG